MRRSRAERGFSIALGLFMLVLATYLFLSSPFFLLESVYLTGNTRYNEADILTIAGLQLQQNLFEININDVIYSLEADPRIAQAEVRRSLPSGLAVRVEDSQVVAVLVGSNGLWQIDGDGRIIEEVTGPHNYVVITLPQNTISPIAGEYVEDPVVRAALAVATAMPLRLATQVSEIIVQSTDQLMLTTRVGVQVQLGTWRDIDEKLQVLGLILEQLHSKTSQPTMIDVSVPTSPVVQ